MNLTRVQSLEHPSLQPYRTLRRSVDHEKHGIFVAEGEKVVRRLLQSGLDVLSLLLTEERFAALRDDLENRNLQNIFIASRDLLATIVGFPFHHGAMAVGKIPASRSLDQVLNSVPKPAVLAAVDGLTNSENLGALVRNCVAFGVQVLIVGETSSSPYLRRAVRNSMGAVFTLPIVHVDNLAETLANLRQEKILTIAAHPSSREHLTSSSEFPASCCVVFGSEGEGLSPGVLDACDRTIGISMGDGVDSLNVASASAVLLFAVTSGMRSPQKTR